MYVHVYILQGLRPIKKSKIENKGEMLLEQVQRFILAKKYFGFRCTLIPIVFA